LNDAGKGPEPPFHLLLDQDEVKVVRTGLNLLSSDEDHEHPIRPLAREVLTALQGRADDRGTVTVPLTPPQMKIAHTAVKLLFDDLRRDQADEREILRRVLDKLPDEHTIRAIRID
jgi:hypothetical protein